jgi:GTP-binding protein HflX
MRSLVLPSGKRVILSDTVGFVSDLPHELVAAFRATLEEVLEADVIVHVRDISHPDSEAQAKDVEEVLIDLGLADAVHGGLVEVLNKTDLLSEDDRRERVNQTGRKSDRIAVSAVTGDGVPTLLSLLDDQLSRNRELVEADISLSDGEGIAWLYRNGEVVQRSDDEQFAHMVVRLDPMNAERFRQRQDKEKGPR